MAVRGRGAVCLRSASLRGKRWLDEEFKLTLLLTLQLVHLVCAAYPVLPLPVSVVGPE